MLKRQKLYRDTNNTIYHVLTDGSIRTYPDFKIITTVDESTLFPEARKVDVLDTLYCDPVHSFAKCSLLCEDGYFPQDWEVPERE